MDKEHALEPVDGDGHAVRSAETRARMVKAAIAVFGASGYEGTSTRVLAERAGVNLAAIPYHFGGKRGLYLAAAQEIANQSSDQMDAIIKRLDEMADQPPAIRLDEAITRFVDIAVGDNRPEAYVAFFVRSERDADEAFHLIHRAITVRFSKVLTAITAEISGSDPDDEDLRMRVSVVMVSILNMRAMLNLTLSSLDWDQLTPQRFSQLSKIIKQMALRELFPALPSGQGLN